MWHSAFLISSDNNRVLLCAIRERLAIKYQLQVFSWEDWAYWHSDNTAPKAWQTWSYLWIFYSCSQPREAHRRTQQFTLHWSNILINDNLIIPKAFITPSMPSFWPTECCHVDESLVFGPKGLFIILRVFPSGLHSHTDNRGLLKVNLYEHT